MEYQRIESTVLRVDIPAKSSMDDEPLLHRAREDTSKIRTTVDSRASISTRGSSEVCIDDPVPHEFKSAFKKLVRYMSSMDPPEKQWLEELSDLFDSCCEIFSYAHAYDFNGETPYNGFRSFNQMILAYFKRIIRVSCKMAPAHTSRRTKNKCEKKLLRLKALIPSLSIQLSLLKMVRARGHEMDTSDFLEEQSMDRKILFAILDIKVSSVTPLYTAGAMNLWLSKSLSRFLRRVYLPLISLKLYPKVSAMRSLVSAELAARLYADFSLNCSLRELRSLWSSGKSATCSSLVRRVANITGPFKVKTFYLQDRQRQWSVSGEKGVMVYRATTEADGSDLADEEGDLSIKRRPVKCRVIRIRAKRSLLKSRRVPREAGHPLKSFILHIHGGGFISGSSKSYLTILKSWVKKTNVPVVSVDYSLAPEHKYPVALQECLDVYMHFNSEGGNAIIAGDSCGGQLSVSLAIALSEINRLSASVGAPANVSMPLALCVQYPSVSACLGVFSPSRVLFDPILPPVSRLLIGSAYSNTIDYYDDGKTCLGGNGTPWYRKNYSNTKEVVAISLEKLSDPFFHLLSYKHFDNLSSVKLFIQAAQFDPLLDDSVMLARCWCGPVTLDVVENVSHGFINFAPFSRHCKLACDLTLKRIGQSLSATA